VFSAVISKSCGVYVVSALAGRASFCLCPPCLSPIHTQYDLHGGAAVGVEMDDSAARKLLMHLAVTCISASDCHTRTTAVIWDTEKIPSQS